MLDDIWKDLPLCVLDVETTGLKADRDRVIEVGIVRFERGEVVERFGQLIDPGVEVPAEVVNITGIKPEDLVGKPAFAEVASKVVEKLSAGVIVAYNLSFDRGFVSAELERAGFAWPDGPQVDPLVFARQLHRTQGSKKLGAVADRLGIALENAHRAVDDAEVTGKVLLAFAQQLPERLRDLLELQRQWEAVQAQEQARWRRARGGDNALLGDSSAGGTVGADELGRPALGPAFIWGEETDFMKALFSGLPDIVARRAG